ncbi:MAG: TonB-dependent receptor [Alphaproteobacteria bacterium]|nr:TonB-dependent receptor [Alphaproteobacteria bacterium]MBU0793520.1 TonB-dependent receptor [Alphaproteobacteria bacterium]MBU0877496.1 TonB-dependent receptor [Alphaproteobacteria bacterium]MBU1768278.1 TonB-dependent receptor [Alphaproteobacteria bacterium]
MSKSANLTSFLALGCVSAVAFAAPATAQEAEQARRLGGMTVTDTAIDESEIKVERAESPKYTRPLLDTPQTITVIGAKTLQQQNLLTLREVLSTVPGITFGAGEGGFGYGDRINLRGYSANNDISVDGVRSGAIVNRNETYNVEQVEIANGANSVFSGAGSVGGSINLVTKKPLADDQMSVQAGIGTDNYYRGTVDLNKRVSDMIAVRLNAVYHENDVPGRQVEFYERWGVAPSVTIGIDGPTSLTLQYEHLDDTGMPQYGIRYFPQQGGYLPDFNREAYYGFRNVDTQQSVTDSVQAIFSHELGDAVSVRNLARYENVSQYTVTSQPAGVFCLASGVQPNGSACTVTIGDGVLDVPAGYYLPTGGRGTARHIRNETAYNQLDLSAEFATGGIEHALVLGGSLLWERYTLNQGSLLRAADGSNPFAAPNYYPLTSIANPNEIIVGPEAPAGTLARVYGSNVYTGPQNFIPTRRGIGEQTSYAAYLFDTMKLSDMFEINGGVRYERFEGSSLSPSLTGEVVAPFEAKNNLFSWRVGGVFKPVPNVSAYVAMGNSRTPSKGSVDGSCSLATCNVEPESAKNYEIGVKADLFDARLQLAAAVFRNERDKYRVASGDPTLPDQVLDGRSRVNGVSLSATGNITDAWSIFANYMYLDTKLIQSVSDFCLANPGEGDCTNSVANPDPNAGTMLSATPKHSGSLFTTYKFPFGLEVGYGLTYQGRHSMNPTATPVYYVPAYTLHRVMLAYPITDQLLAQLNVQNVTDEDYVTTVRTNVNNSWAQPGVGRSAVFSLSYSY